MSSAKIYSNCSLEAEFLPRKSWRACKVAAKHLRTCVLPVPFLPIRTFIPLVKSNQVFAKPVKSVNNMLLIIEYVSFILSNYKGNLKNGSDKPGFKKVMIIRLMF